LALDEAIRQLGIYPARLAQISFFLRPIWDTAKQTGHQRVLGLLAQGRLKLAQHADG